MSMTRSAAIVCAAALIASTGPAMAQAVPQHFFSVVNGLRVEVQCQLDGGPWFTILPGGRWSQTADHPQAIIFCQPPVRSAKFPISAGERYVIEPMSDGKIGVVQVGEH
jgi:hypothetical protein